jgi:hypothetical protein
MSKYKKDSSEETKNNWITPTVIAAVIGLIGTLITLYFGYLTSTRPLEIAATQTADARIFQLTLAGLTPTPGQPTATATLLPPTATLEPTPVPPPATLIPTRTLAPTELKFCIDARSIYVRSGPGTEFGAIGALSFEDCLYFDGQNPDSTWLHISPGQDKFPDLNDGWVRSNLVRPQDFTQLPIIQPPTATPTPEG